MVADDDRAKVRFGQCGCGRSQISYLRHATTHPLRFKCRRAVCPADSASSTSWVASLSRASEFGASLGLRHLSTRSSHRIFVPPRDYSRTAPLWVSEGSPVETVPSFLLILGNQLLGTLDIFRQVRRPSVRPDHLHQTDRVRVLDPLRLFGHIRHTMQKVPNSVMTKPH